MKKWFLLIWHELKEIKSTKKELREFAVVMGSAFLIFAGIKFLRHKNFLPFLSISGMFFVSAYLNPYILKPLQKLWMGFAVIMGYFMTRLILGILFFLVLTPLSFISRLSGKKFLDIRFRSESDSYWIQKPIQEFSKKHYEHQF